MEIINSKGYVKQLLAALLVLVVLPTAASADRKFLSLFLSRNLVLAVLSLSFLVPSTQAAEPDATHVKQATEAVEAIYYGKPEKVKELVEAGLPVDTISKSGFTMLYAAAQEGKGPLVEYLLENGADPMLELRYGQTPMHAALDHPSLLPGMVKVGGDVNKANKNGETMLMTAASMSKPETTKTLLELGADPLKVDAKGRNVLFHALSNRKKYAGPIYAMLMERNIPLDKTDKDGETLLMVAVLGHEGMVEDLLDRGLSPWVTNNKGVSTLDLAVMGGSVATVEKLLARNPPKDLLQRAFETSLSHRYHMVPKLLAAGAEAKDPQLLFKALEGGEWETLRILLAQGLDPNVKDPKEQRTPLQVAFRKSKPELVRLLLQYGADISAIGEDDLQYVDVLDEEDGKPMLELLIVAGLKPDIQIYGESLSSILQNSEQKDLLALLKNPLREGCLAIEKPLSGNHLTDQRKAFVGRWQRKDDIGDVLYILTENGQAQQEVDIMGVQKTRGSWQLRDSHFEFHSMKEGKPEVLRLGVHCVAADKFILGNSDKPMVFTRVEGEAVLPLESAEPADTLGPVGDKLTDEQAAKLIARLQCYAQSYTSDEERTAALMAYIEPSGIKSPDGLMSQLAPFLKDKSFQQNNVMTLMSEMLKCRQNLPSVTVKKDTKSKDRVPVAVKAKVEAITQKKRDKGMDLTKQLRRTWCLYETVANGHSSAAKANITFMSGDKYDWNDDLVNKTGEWSISNETLVLKDVDTFTVKLISSDVVELKGTETWRLKKGLCD